MTTSRRDVLRGLGVAAIGGALAPGLAWADRIRVLGGGPAPTAAGVERHPPLERLAAGLTAGEARERGSLAIVWLHARALAPALDVATLDEAQRERCPDDHRARARDGARPDRRQPGPAAGPAARGRDPARRQAEPRAGRGRLAAGAQRAAQHRRLLRRGRAVVGLERALRVEGRLCAVAAALGGARPGRPAARAGAPSSGYAAQAAAPSATQSYAAVVERPEVKEHIRRVEDDLDQPPAGAIGAAAFVGARLAGLDVFQDVALFTRLWPKLLRAHAVEVFRTAAGAADAAAREARLRAALDAMQHARGASRRNVGTARSSSSAWATCEVLRSPPATTSCTWRWCRRSDRAAVFFGGRAGERRRRARSTTPTVIAESATLKAGQCQPRQWTSTKSTTAPKRARSIRLPTAPPKMSPIAARPVGPPAGQHAQRHARQHEERDDREHGHHPAPGLAAARPAGRRPARGSARASARAKPSTTVDGDAEREALQGRPPW